MAAGIADGYADGLDRWQKETVASIRKTIKKAAPEASETIKWAQPVYESNGPFAYIKAFKNSVNFGFWRGIDLEDPENLLQGTGNKMRHVTLTGPADINRAPSRISFGKRRRSTSGRAIQPKADRPAKPAGK